MKQNLNKKEKKERRPIEDIMEDIMAQLKIKNSQLIYPLYNQKTNYTTPLHYHNLNQKEKKAQETFKAIFAPKFIKSIAEKYLSNQVNETPHTSTGCSCKMCIPQYIEPSENKGDTISAKDFFTPKHTEEDKYDTNGLPKFHALAINQEITPKHTENWSEELIEKFNKPNSNNCILGKYLLNALKYYEGSREISNEKEDKKLNDWLISFIKSLLAKEREEAKKEYMDVSTWKNIGEKYHFFDFFEKKYREEVIKIVEGSKKDGIEINFEEDNFASGYNQALEDLKIKLKGE